MTTTQELSARAQVRQWVREQMEDASEVDLPALAGRAVAHFRGDAAFIQTFLDESLPTLVYDIASSIGSKTRLLSFGDHLATRATVADAATRHTVFERWLEHAGARHIRLLSMTKADLLVAAEERRKRGEHDMWLSRLWVRIAKDMSDEDTVGERFTTEEIEKLAQELHTP